MPSLELLARLGVDGPEGIAWTTDRNLRITTCAGPVQAILEHHPDSVPGVTLGQFFRAEPSAAIVIDAHRRALEGQRVSFEIEVGRHHLRGRVTADTDENGTPRGCIGVAERLRRDTPTKEQLRQFFDQSVQMHCIGGGDGYFKRVNSAFEKILGFSPREMRSEPFLHFVHPEDRAATLQQFDRLARGEPMIQFETRFRRKDGSYRWLAWTSAPLRDGLLYASALDITDRKQAEDLFRRSLESAPDALIIVDQEGRIQLVNALAEQLFGYRREEMSGQSIEMIIPEQLRARHRQHRSEYANQPRIRPMGAGVELVALRKDGTTFPAEISLGPMKTETGFLVLSAIRDITERKRAEQALREKRAELLAAQRIHERLLPQTPPSLPGFDIYGATLAAEFAGGDYFDYFPMLDQAFVTAVGDVTGHGFGSALLMAHTRSELRSWVRARRDVNEVLERLNDDLVIETEEHIFVTLLLVCLHPNSRRLCYSSAGHPPGLILDSSGRLKHKLCSTGLPLGILAEERYAKGGPIDLEPGDLVLLMTDGVLEAESADQEMFGYERVLAVVRDNRHEPAREILDRLFSAVRTFNGNGKLSDDVSAVLIKCDPLASWTPPRPRGTRGSGQT
ncbi:MAG: PAS domain S-box protein [Acidobacteriota bacterium]|nr:MAG: PAS domain S-box protein [Acidobacteriota bacterium]